MAQRIIVVEDEHIVGLDIKLHLEGLGYTVDGVFPSGEAALEQMARSQPDLAVLDIRLQGELDGLETAEQVRELYGIPVILLTALADERTIQRAKHSEPFAYIIKPFEPRELRTAIEIAFFRHEMEQTILRREQLFSTTLESIQDAVIVTGNDRAVEYVNSVAQKLLGYDRESLVGNPLDSRMTLMRDDGSVLELGRVNGEQVVAVMAEDRRVPVECSISPLAGGDGKAGGWVVVLHDITERQTNERILREQEEKLRQSQKMEAIGRLTGGIAHDFNNLLTVIMGYSKLLMDELSTLEGVDISALQNDVDGIQKAALRSASLTRQLLAFSRHQIMERKVVEFNQIVSDMEKMLERLIGDDVRLQVDLLASPSAVYADPGQLEQVLLNLAVNAKDAMPGGGRVLVRTELRSLTNSDLNGQTDISPGDFVVLTVRDSGTGMDEQTLSRIFEPFFTTKEHGRGTGLGLSTVYGIVAQSGGFVNVRSTPGAGSEFAVFLPLYADKVAVQEGESLVKVDTAGTETILLVEDDEAIRNLLSRVLSRKGYRVLEVANAGEALLQWEDAGDQVALVVSDVVLPHLSGDKLVERLRESSPGVKALLLSAYPESHITEDERRRLGHHFMQKPLDPESFVQRVRRILDE